MTDMLYRKALHVANQLFKNKRYEESIVFYEAAINLEQELCEVYSFNVDFSRRRALDLWGIDKTRVIALNSINQLIPHDVENKWMSLGEDPFYFFDKEIVHKLKSSWVVLQFKIKTSLEKNKAKLYFDYGKDFTEDESITIEFNSEVLVSRVIRIRESLINIRFDPIEAIGEFHLQLLTVDEIDEDTAKSLMISRLLAMSEEKETTDTYINRLIAKCESEGTPLIERTTDLYLASYKADQNVSYRVWIEKIEKPSIPTDMIIAQTIEKFHKKPKISVIVPVYNTPEEFLGACIDSVINQTYRNWELCIADDKSSKSHVKKILEKYEKLDNRIRIVYRNENGNISRASNSALEMATGDFIALLDHDDLLASNALYHVVESINKHPSAQIIYSDEDKVDENGQRFDPHFKSDWNLDLFYSQNYVSHLGVYKAEILKKIKGFRVGFEGSQDQDLLLRCLPHTNPENIIHIAKILYHWRALKGSTALAAGEKNYTTEAGIKALKDHFDESNRQDVIIVEGQVPNTYRVHWPVPPSQPLVSLIIPTRDKKEITELAVTSIINKTTYENYEIIIIDNGSVEQETLAWFKEIQKNVRISVLRYDKPFNYSAINNFGVRHAKGTILGLINNDVEVISPEWLTEMVSHAIRPDIGCVGAKLYFGNNTIQHAGVILGIGGVAGHSHKYFNRADYGYFSRLCLTQSLSAVTAACLIVRKEIFEKVGGLDEENLTVAFNDVDFCLKVSEKGYRNLWSPYAELFHHESISRGSEDSPEKISRFNLEVSYMKKKWGKLLRIDPYYNKNLTLVHENFQLGEA